MPELADLVLNGLQEVPPQPNVDSNLADLVLKGLPQPPASIPHTPLQTAMDRTVVDQEVQRARVNTELLQKFSLGMSQWDDYNASMKKSGAVDAGQLVNVTAANEAESMFRFLAKEGYTVDASVLSGNRLQALTGKTDEDFARLLDATGWKDVLTGDEAKTLHRSMLMRNMVANMRPSHARWNQAATTAFNTLIDEQANLLGGAASQGGGNYPERFEAIANLKALPERDRAAVVKYSMWHLGADEERSDADAAARREGRPGAMDMVLRHHEHEKTLNQIRVAFGTDEPEKLLATQNRKIQEAFTFKDLGFLEGDITNHGVMVVDPATPGGLTPLSFAPFDMIQKIEERAAMGRVQGAGKPKGRGELTGVAAPTSPLDATIDQPTVQSFILEYGEELGREKLAQRMAADRLTRVQAVSAQLAMGPDVATMLPEGQKALGPIDRSFLWFAHKADSVFAAGASVAKGLDDVVSSTPQGQALAKSLTLAGVDNVELAAQTNNFRQAFSTVMHALTETGRVGQALGDLQAAAQGAVNTLHAAATQPPEVVAEIRRQNKAKEDRALDVLVGTMKGSGNVSGSEFEAFKTLDPATRATIFNTFNSAHRFLDKQGAGADAEQDVRTRRMADYLAGRGSDPRSFFEDTVGTLYYQLGMQVRGAVGDFIDNPEKVAGGIIASYPIGLGIKGVAAARNEMTSLLLRGAKIREASKIVGQYLPSEFNRIKASLNAAIDAGVGGVQHVQAAATELDALAQEAKLAERMGSFDPNKGTVSRFANSMARAFPHLAENTPKAIVDIVSTLPGGSSMWLPSDILRSVKSVTKAPIDSLVAGTQTAKAAQANVIQYVRRMLDVNPASAELSVMRAQRARAIAEGNSAAVTDLTDRIAQLGADPRGAASPLEAIAIITEKDRIAGRLEEHARVLTDLERSYAAKPDPTVQAQMDQVRLDMAGASHRHNLLTDQLRNGPVLEEMDVAQLLVARDTGKLGRDFFGAASEKIHNGIARLFGTTDFESVKQAGTAVDRLTNFMSNKATEWLDLKARQGRGKMRNDLLYRRGVTGINHELEEIQNNLHYIDVQLSSGDPAILQSDAGEFLREMRSEYTTRNARLVTDRDQLYEEWNAMNALPAGAAWNLNEKHISRVLTPEQMVDVVRNNGEYFDFFDPGSPELLNPEQVQQLATHKAQLGQARVGVTEDLRATQAELKKIQPAYDKIRNTPAPPTGTHIEGEQIVVDLEAPTKAGPTKVGRSPEEERVFRIRSRYEMLDAKAAALETQQRRLAIQGKEIRDRLSQHVLDEEGRARVPGLFRIEGANEVLQRDVQLLNYDAEAAKALQDLGSSVNPMLAGHIPLHLKGLAVYKNLLTTKHQLQADGVRLEALTDFMNHATPAQREVISRGLRSGELPSSLAKTEPSLALATGVETKGARPMLENLDNYIKWEKNAQAELLEEGRRTGLIDEATYSRLRSKGYDPGVYALHEGPELVRTPKLEKLRRSLSTPGKGPGMTPGLSSDELRFKRDLTQWRVFSQERDGFTRDVFFDTPEAAAQYVRDTFGVEVEKVGADGFAKTTAGGNITVARPIGEEGLKTLGFEEGMLPERRLTRFQQLHQDIAMHRFLSSNRGVPGMVLMPEEFTAQARRAGKKSSEFETQYMQLPNNQTRYGNLAGAFVHRKVLSEVNAMQHSFTQLQSWVAGVMDAYSDFTRFTPRLFGKIPIASGKVIGGINRLVKTSQILLSWKTWVGNMTSNVFADYFVGGKVFSSENLDNLRRAIDEVTIAAKSPRDFLGAVSPADYTEAARLGILNGTVFDKSNEPFRRMLVRAIGWDDAGKIRAHRERLVALREEEVRLHQTREVKDTARWQELELAIGAQEAALADFNKGRLAKFAKETSGFFMLGKDARGLPASVLGKKLRDKYGMIDDVFRYASFLNLKRVGHSAESAAQRILEFAQNYGNVPTAVGNLSQSLAGSLVPMFPYEQARLMRNYAVKEPLKLLGALSLIPAINAISAGLAGVPLSRITAMHRASGDATSGDILVGQATQLYMWNPTTKEAEDIVPFGRTFTPGFQLMSDYGVLNEAVKKWVPDEDDSVSTNVMRVAGKTASSFVLNNPIVNNVFALLQQKDPVTGQPYNNDRGSFMENFGHVLAGAAKTLVPPWAPVIGRVASDFRGSTDIPIHPETGKPYGQQQLGTMLLRELTAIPARGRLAKGVGDVVRDTGRLMGLDMGDKTERGVAVPDESVMISMMYAAEKSIHGETYSNQLAMYGVDAEKRKFWALLMSNASTPAQKAAAEAGLKDLAARERQVVVNGNKFAFTPTDREQAAYLRAVKQRGAVDHFSRLDLRAQTMVLVEGNKALVNPKTLNDYAEAVRMTDTWQTAMKSDPGQINQALSIVEPWLTDPRAAPAVKDWYNWLVKIQARSTKLFQVETLRQARMEKLRAEGAVR